MQPLTALMKACLHHTSPAAIAIEVAAERFPRPGVGDGAVTANMTPPVFVLALLLVLALAFAFLDGLSCCGSSRFLPRPAM